MISVAIYPPPLGRVIIKKHVTHQFILLGWSPVSKDNVQFYLEWHLCRVKQPWSQSISCELRCSPTQSSPHLARKSFPRFIRFYVSRISQSALVGVILRKLKPSASASIDRIGLQELSQFLLNSKNVWRLHNICQTKVIFQGVVKVLHWTSHTFLDSKQWHSLAHQLVTMGIQRWPCPSQ